MDMGIVFGLPVVAVLMLAAAVALVMNRRAAVGTSRYVVSGGLFAGFMAGAATVLVWMISLID